MAALFTGAAVYNNVAGQPARLALDDRALLVQWMQAYERGFALQVSLAGTGGLLGLLAFGHSGWDLRWLGGAVLLLAYWPWTLLGIMPTNHRLNAILRDQSGPESRGLILAWGRLHAVHSGLGTAATLVFLWAAAG